MIVSNLILPTLLLVPSAFAGRIKYEVRLVRPDWTRTTRSSTLNMPDEHLQLIADNMRTWSNERFRGSMSGYHENMVIVGNTGEIQYDVAAADEMIREMALVVMCNVPGAPAQGAASITGFNRNRDCKKRKTRNRVLDMQPSSLEDDLESE